MSVREEGGLRAAFPGRVRGRPGRHTGQLVVQPSRMRSAAETVSVQPPPAVRPRPPTGTVPGPAQAGQDLLLRATGGEAATGVTGVGIIVGTIIVDGPVLRGPGYIRRSTIIFLISAMALAGLSPLGQERVQFMIV